VAVFAAAQFQSMNDDELLARDDKRIRKSLAQHFM
jgi:hypothetical protein